MIFLSFCLKIEFICENIFGEFNRDLLYFVFPVGVD